MSGIFDHDLIYNRCLKGQIADFNAMPLWQKFSQHALESLADIEFPKPPTVCIDLNACSGLVAASLQARFANSSVISALPSFMSPLDSDGKCLIYDPHSLQEVPNVDMAICLGLLHMISELPKVLSEIYRIMLKPGVFICNVFGPQTLYDIRKTFIMVENDLYGVVTPRFPAMLELKDAASLLQIAGFKEVIATTEIIKLRCRDWWHLCKFLQSIGGNIMLQRTNTPVGKDFFLACADYYKNNFSSGDNSVVTSIEFILLVGLNH